MKECFICHERKPIDCFYKHKMMADGHLNKCKECTKKNVRDNRKEKIEYYREYDIKRCNRQSLEYTPDYRNRFPNKYAAHTAVGNAVRIGVLVRLGCESCGESSKKTHAHHDDYLDQLNVRWLCPSCHKKWHDENGEGLNGS